MMVKKKGDNPLAGLTRFNVDPNPVTPATLRGNILLVSKMKDSSEQIEDAEYRINKLKNTPDDTGWGNKDDRERSIKENRKRIVKDNQHIEELKSTQKNVMEGKVTPTESNNKWNHNTWMSQSLLNGPRWEIAYGEKNLSGIEENYPSSYAENPYFNFEYGPEEYKKAASVATGYKYADARSTWSHGRYESQNKMPKHVVELNAAEPWRNRNPERYGSTDSTGEYKEWIKTQYDTAAHGAPKVTVADIFTRGYKPTEGFKLKNPVGEPAKPVKEHMASPQFAQHEQLSFDFPKYEQLSLF